MSKMFPAVFLAVGLLVSCASDLPPPSQLSTIEPTYNGPGDGAGTIIDAIPLATETPRVTTRYLNPAAVSVLVKPDFLTRRGFFKEVKQLIPQLKLVRQIKIHYWSTDPLGRPVQLSGLMLLPFSNPGDATQVPLLLLCHGTQLVRDRVPSRLYGAERLIGVLAAASGIAVVMPDYPGLGDSAGFHPYLLEKSLAPAGVDALRALRNWIKNDSEDAYVEQPKTFLAGYSEGGYAAMAALKLLETSFPDEFPLQVAFPMGIPADMSGTMRRMMAGEKPVAAPYYVPYTVLGWAPYAKGLDPQSVFRPDVVRFILPMMDGTVEGPVVSKEIARIQGVAQGEAVASRMFSPDSLKALRDDGVGAQGQILNRLLRENDLHNWQPNAKVRIVLAASPEDELVPCENSRVTYDHFKAVGAPVEFIELSKNHHAQAALEGYGCMLLDIWKNLGR